MNRRPAYPNPLVHVGLIVGLAALVLAPAIPGCSPPATFSAAMEERRTPLQRRTGPVPRPPQNPAPGAIKVSGTERLQWEQDGKSLEQVRRWRYVAVVGLARRNMRDVTCEGPRVPKGPFVCRGLLPALEPGNHQLRVVAIEDRAGRELASPWSRPILVFKEEPGR
jgi:hypothetical protein